jgi:hypothetical protein
MSATDGKPRGRPPYRQQTKHMDAQPGDEQATWSRKRLLRMDGRFQARLERAFRRGKENRAAAAQRITTPLW